MGVQATLSGPYFFKELAVNAPAVVARVSDPLPPQQTCRFCAAPVELVHNAAIYGKAYGWPLTYLCRGCGAKVGCHNGTDIPLGTLADKVTQRARQAAHAAIDPLWQGQGAAARKAVYRRMAELLGVPVFHISWLDADQCLKVVELADSLCGVLRDQVCD